MYQSAVSFPHPFFFEFCQQRRRSRIFFFYFFCEVHTFLVSPNCGSHDSTVCFFALWTPCAKSVGVAGSQFVCVCVCGVWAHGSSSSTFAVVNQQLNKKRKRKQNKTKSTLLQIEAWFGNVPRPFRPHRKLLLAEWLADCRKRRNLGTGRCLQGRVNFFFCGDFVLNHA